MAILTTIIIIFIAAVGGYTIYHYNCRRNQQPYTYEQARAWDARWPPE